MSITQVRATCPHDCPDTCALLVTVEDGVATEVRGDPSSRSFSVAYLRNGRMIALDCINSTRDYVQARKQIADASNLDRAAQGR